MAPEAGPTSRARDTCAAQGQPLFAARARVAAAPSAPTRCPARNRPSARSDPNLASAQPTPPITSGSAPITRSGCAMNHGEVPRVHQCPRRKAGSPVATSLYQGRFASGVMWVPVRIATRIITATSEMVRGNRESQRRVRSRTRTAFGGSGRSAGSTGSVGAAFAGGSLMGDILRSECCGTTSERGVRPRNGTGVPSFIPAGEGPGGLSDPPDSDRDPPDRPCAGPRAVAEA